jgi:hypothetical protein
MFDLAKIAKGESYGKLRSLGGTDFLLNALKTSKAEGISSLTVDSRINT